MGWPTVAILPCEAVSRHQRLLKALSELFSVEFVGKTDLDRKSCDGVLLFDTDRKQAIRWAASGVRCLAFVKSDPPIFLAPEKGVRMAPAPYVARCFQGKTLPDRTLDRASSLSAGDGDDIVARKGDDILWIRRREGGSSVDLVALEPPALAEHDFLFQHFRLENWARLLPLFHFLREISGWEPPPVRACFMFDDPNLHANSYGYIKYQDLARHAEKYNYHVAFATIPMDGWYVNKSTAALFRANKNRFSLLIHGNNHTFNELARSYPERQRCALAAQALGRTARLERLSGLEVSRVMAAPHHACHDDMAEVLLRAGFEAACISPAFIKKHNQSDRLSVNLGLSMAEFLGNGLPAIPRFDLARDCKFQILFAAFLGQPIIPVGHHEDLAGGLDLLQELADLINSIGEVRWMGMKSMARSNFRKRREDKILHLKMYSRNVRLHVPANVATLCIERPWLDANNREDLELSEDNGASETMPSYGGQPIPVRAGADLEIISTCPGRMEPGEVPMPRTPLWAVTRRLLCEGRDRLRPTVDWMLPSRVRSK